MKRITKRQAAILAAGLLVAGSAASAGSGAAQSTDLSGTITFADGKTVPEGHIEIHFEDPAASDRMIPAPTAQIRSEGGRTSLSFVLPLPENGTVSPSLQVVARLERADGWLLARGSAKVMTGAHVTISLFRVVY